MRDQFFPSTVFALSPEQAPPYFLAVAPSLHIAASSASFKQVK
jgi:hypothetical protein